MKTKTIQIRLSVWCFFLLILSGCDLHLFEYPKIYQFTSDDLSFLYFNQDTLTYDIEKDEAINYSDSVYFLYNSKDTCSAKIWTRINSHVNVFWGVENYLDGESEVYFNNIGNFMSAHINTSKQFENELYKMFEVYRKNFTSQFEFISSQNLEFDTALVLNHLYSGVLKFYPSKKDSTNKFKSIFFAKKFGYIKLETVDGEKLELINDLK
jgi:hypothetical protein